MSTLSFTLEGQDGQPFAVRGWLPERTPSAVVQLAHGMSEHAGRYDWVAGRLNAAGYAVYADDHRGHGATAELQGLPLGHAGDHGGWEAMLSDLYVLNRHIAEQHPKLPVCFVGHSMGAHLGQTFAMRHGEQLSGLFLCGASGKVGALRLIAWALTRIERLRQGKRGRSALVNAMSFGDFNKPFAPARTAFDWLSRDEAQVDAYIADPLCGFTCSNQFWVDLIDGIGHNENDANFNQVPAALPVRIITGSRDSSNKGEFGTSALADRFRAAGTRNLDVEVYPDGRHEMFSETNREQVITDTIAWLNRVCGGTQ